MSQYDADAAGGEPSPASSSVTPTENVGLASNANEALARALVASVSDDPTYGLSILVHRDAIPKFAEWLAAFMRDDGYEVRPIEQRCAIRNRRYGPCTLTKGHDGLHQWSDIEQADDDAS